MLNAQNPDCDPCSVGATNEQGAWPWKEKKCQSMEAEVIIHTYFTFINIIQTFSWPTAARDFLRLYVQTVPALLRCTRTGLQVYQVIVAVIEQVTFLAVRSFL